MEPLKKILIIDNSIDITGAITAIVQSSVYLKDQFLFLFILPSQSKAIPLVQQNGFEVEELPMIEIQKRFVSLVTYWPVLFGNVVRLRKIIKSRKIDCIHVNDYYNLIPAIYSLLGGRVPYICHVRFLPSRFPKYLQWLWERINFKYAFRIVAVSKIVYDQLPKSRKKVFSYDGYLALKDFSTPNSTTILYVANYIKGKGQEYAIKSFAPLTKKFPQWKLRFIGGDMGLAKNKEYKQALKGLVSSLGLENQIIFEGYVKEITSEYGKSAMVLNFSDSESFSLTCLEAQVSGRAVIATRCGGPEEIVINGQTGILVEVGNIEDMTVALNELLLDDKKRCQMGLNAYENAITKFSPEKTFGQLSTIYLTSMKMNYAV
jgi:glycosyltransferase involved in cell wall biosynthesis